MMIPVLVFAHLAAIAQAFYSRLNHNSSIHDAIPRNLSRRWTDIVKTYPSPGTVWPRDASNIATVRFCFADQDAWDDTHAAVFAAVNMWNGKMLLPSAQNGHSLYIDLSPHAGQNPAPFCWTQVPNDIRAENQGVWNSQVNPASFVIWSERGTGTIGGLATWAYSRNNGNENRMILHAVEYPAFNPAAQQTFIVNVAHEFGHVFGLFHEHQRPDRDQWIHFDCQLLKGYYQVQQDLRNRKALGQQPPTIQQVCSDWNLATQNFPMVVDFVKEQHVGFSAQFDYSSIMLYSSKMGTASASQGNLYYNAPIVKWKTPYLNGAKPPARRNAFNCDLINTNTQISDGDLAGIKYLYPW